MGPISLYAKYYESSLDLNCQCGQQSAGTCLLHYQLAQTNPSRRRKRLPIYARDNC